MIDFLGPFNWFSDYFPAIKTLAFVLVIFLIFHFIINAVKNALMRHVKTKRHKSDVEIFTRVIQIIFLVILILVAYSTYYKNWTGLGIGAGLLTAALGWALQRPITGIAAWIMVVLKRPFEVGDRVIIGDTKGDVVDISLTHLHLSEIGGTVASEESSGRVILIPNSILFEQKVINYTLVNEFILDEAVTLVTYESNLEKAKKICYDAAEEFFYEELKKEKEHQMVRVFQQDSGIHVKVRYRVRAGKSKETLSNIHNKIISTINKTSDVDIAYPHMHLIMSL